jgi:hypothetical protein
LKLQTLITCNAEDGSDYAHCLPKLIQNPKARLEKGSKASGVNIQATLSKALYRQRRGLVESGAAELSELAIGKRETELRRLDAMSSCCNSSLTPGMASPLIIRAAIDKRTADTACEELQKFIQTHSPDVVQKEKEKVFYFDAQLEPQTPELRIASAAVDGFVSVCSFLVKPLIFFPH